MSATPSEISEVIDLRPSATDRPAGPSTILARSSTLEVRRLTLSAGREIPTHQAPGEIAVQCLEGRIAFNALGTRRDLVAGQMIVLAAGVPHSVLCLEDATVLVTKVLSASRHAEVAS